MSNTKDICPVCGVNEKGIKSKTCKPCFVKSHPKFSKSKPVEPKPVEPESQIGKTRNNGMFYV